MFQDHTKVEHYQVWAILDDTFYKKDSQNFKMPILVQATLR